jgi:hypothetical protein
MEYFAIYAPSVEGTGESTHDPVKRRQKLG